MSQESAPFLSVVIPCYNEEEVFPAMLLRVEQACVTVTPDYEIVLVNDGSTDKTWSLILAAYERNPRIVGIDLSRNHGHQLALSAGLQICRGQRILIIDADLQDPPELLKEMNALMESSGADVVYGQRNLRSGEPLWRLTCISYFYKLLSFLADTQIPPQSGDFKLLRRNIVNHLCSLPEQSRFLRGMTAWLGYRQIPFLYDRDARAAGISKYSLRKLIGLAMDGILSFSVKPLRLAIWLGLILSVGSLLGIFYILFAWLLGINAPRGWASLVVLILFVSSIQLVVLGIIGEYLGRVFLESKRRPLFIIREIKTR